MKGILGPQTRPQRAADLRTLTSRLLRGPCTARVRTRRRHGRALRAKRAAPAFDPKVAGSRPARPIAHKPLIGLFIGVESRCDFDSLEAVYERLLLRPVPVEWTFTRADLNRLLQRIEAR
jgi:hypothetical protein